MLLGLILLLQSSSSNLNASTWIKIFRRLLVLDQHLSIVTGASWSPEWLHITLISINRSFSIRNRRLASWQLSGEVCWGMGIPLFNLLLGSLESGFSGDSRLLRMVLLLFLYLIFRIWKRSCEGWSMLHGDALTIRWPTKQLSYLWLVIVSL